MLSALLTLFFMRKIIKLRVKRRKGITDYSELSYYKSWKIRVTGQNNRIMCIEQLFTDGMSFPAKETAGNIFKE